MSEQVPAPTKPITTTSTHSPPQPTPQTSDDTPAGSNVVARLSASRRLSFESSGADSDSDVEPESIVQPNPAELQVQPEPNASTSTGRVTEEDERDEEEVRGPTTEHAGPTNEVVPTVPRILNNDRLLVGSPNLWLTIPSNPEDLTEFIHLNLATRPNVRYLSLVMKRDLKNEFLGSVRSASLDVKAVTISFAQAQPPLVNCITGKDLGSFLIGRKSLKHLHPKHLTIASTDASVMFDPPLSRERFCRLDNK